MKFEIEAEVLVKGFSMIMENQNRNHEVALKVLDKTLDIADKFLDIAAASIKASDERSRIRFEQEQEERKLRLERAAEEAAERKAQYAENQAERDLAAARRQKEMEELNKKSS
jgi:hypothetical protein